MMQKKQIAVISIVLTAFLLITGLIFNEKYLPPFPVAAPVQGSSAFPTVIVDAGHGGVDGGASGADGTVEKELNLQIALKLREQLAVQGFNVIMTREEDISIHDPDATSVRQKKKTDLFNRMKIMENTPNCIYVSIHQNSFPDKSQHGTQIFFGDNNPASEILAKNVQEAIQTNLQPENKRKIKKSGKDIYLLYYSEVPIIMVECGFISNANEAKRLRDEQYQNQLSFVISQGIIQYCGAQS